MFYGHDNRNALPTQARKRWAGKRRHWLGLEWTRDCSTGSSVSLFLSKWARSTSCWLREVPTPVLFSAVCWGACRNCQHYMLWAHQGLRSRIRLHYFKVKKKVESIVCFGKKKKTNQHFSFCKQRVFPKLMKEHKHFLKRQPGRKLIIHCFRKQSYPSTITATPVKEGTILESDSSLFS